MTRARDLADSADKDIAGTVTLDDIILSNDITLADNGKAIFGAGSDLQIYHDGSDSIITDTGTGNLIVKTDGNNIQFEDGSGNDIFKVTPTATNIYHGTSGVKLQTTATGIDVTGTVTANAASLNNDAASFSISSADLTRYQRFRRNASNSLILDKYNGSTTTNTAKFDENGDITFYDTDGTTASFVYDASAGTTFNDGGADRDFRVESDAKEKMLFVDGGENVVAMGMLDNYTTPSWIGNGSVVMADNFYQFQGANVNDGVWNQSVDTNQSYHMHNAYYSGGWKQHVANVSATMYQSGSGLHRFQVANANTSADQAISWRVLLNMNEADGFHWNSNDYSTADFRVESDSNSYMLFVDAGNNRVGIGEGSPDAEVHIGGAHPHIDLGPKSLNRAKLGFRYDNLYLGATAGGGEVILKNNISSTDAPDASGDEIARFGDTIIFNESQRNQDFRVESDTRTHAIFVDADHGAGGAVKLISASENITSVEKGAYFAENNGNFVHMVLVNESTAANHSLMYLNRQSSDGTFIEFRQANVTEGTVTISGSTVSYNGFAGRHESSGIANTVEKGTVLSTIDELDTYPNQQYDSAEDAMVDHPRAGQDRTDHAKVKVSDTEGDTRVYGVVDDYTDQGKVNVIGVGIGSIKVTGSCSGGDLLESNGDGTAKVQSDDIIRSKTIGKVTVGNSNTGVKLVSCVLYCG